LFKTDASKDKKKNGTKIENLELLPPRVMVGDKGAYYPSIDQDIDSESTWEALSSSESNSQAMSVDGSDHNNINMESSASSRGIYRCIYMYIYMHIYKYIYATNYDLFTILI
jgi:hypothetical protein